MKRKLPLLLLLTLFGLSGCATIVFNSHTAEQNGQITKMPGFLARKYALQALKADPGIAAGNSQIVNLVIGPDHFSYEYKYLKTSRANQPCLYRYRSIEGITVEENAGWLRAHVGACDVLWSAENREAALNFGKAVATLERYFTRNPRPPIEEALKRIQKMIDAAPKGTPVNAMSEEARKFRVQAEADFDQKNYDDAILDYLKALELAPKWAEGYYNLALIFGQEGFIPDAIIMMKTYLSLTPDAKDRRASMDQLYVWEGRLEKEWPNN